MTPMEQPERPRQEGNVHHLETQLRARVQMMIAWEARREAREIVKRKLKAQGVKVSLLSASTITQHANDYLRRHAAELLAAAEASAAHPSSGQMGHLKGLFPAPTDSRTATSARRPVSWRHGHPFP